MLQPLRSPTFARLNTQTRSGLDFGVSEGGGAWSWIVNLGIFLIVLFIILLVVHYTITPIFTFGLTGQGLFAVSNASDSELIWTDGPQPSTTAANFQKISAMNFTLQMDVYVEEVLSTLGQANRVFLYRANEPIQSAAGETLSDQYPDSNLVCYLKPETNDLVVTTITENNADLYLESTPTLLNIPIRQPFRLTITLQPQLLEVYLNGKLTGSKVLRFQPKTTTKAFYGTPDMFRNSIRIMNLQYWNYPLTAMQIINAPPALATSDKFSPAPLPSAQGTCS